MKQFEGGWIWMKNIKEFSQNAISILEKNEGQFDLDKITQKIKGELITDWKIYADTEWIIKFQPFMNDYLLFIYNKNEEFGSEIKIFFNKQFLRDVPTEDAYCFVELYLKQLIRYIDTPIHETLISGDNLTIDELLDIVDKENKEKLKHEILEIRAQIINKIPKDPELLNDIAKKLDGNFFLDRWDNNKIDWCLSFFPLKNVEIFNVLKDGKYHVFYSTQVLNLEPRDILFFTWLFCNAIIREARKKLGDKLPKLSKYL
jgi:hypothetical protein